MAISSPSQRFGLISRRLFCWFASVVVLGYVLYSLWNQLPASWAVQRAHQAAEARKQHALELALQRAQESRNSDALIAVAKDASAPGEIRGTAWATLAKRSAESGDKVKAADYYVSALDSLTAERTLTANGYTLRDEVWDQLRFHLGDAVDIQQYRTALISWAERTQDQRLLQQLLFELGKMNVLAKAESADKKAIKP